MKSKTKIAKMHASLSEIFTPNIVMSTRVLTLETSYHDT